MIRFHIHLVEGLFASSVVVWSSLCKKSPWRNTTNLLTSSKRLKVFSSPLVTFFFNCLRFKTLSKPSLGASQCERTSNSNAIFFLTDSLYLTTVFYIYIYIIKSRWQHGFPWLSLSPSVPIIHHSRQVFQIIFCPHRAAVNKFLLVGQH